MRNRYTWRQKPERLWWIEPETWGCWFCGTLLSALWWWCAEQTPGGGWPTFALIVLAVAVIVLVVAAWFTILDWLDR